MMIDKPNAFEHGLMLGYLLLPENGGSTPAQTEDERTLDDGTILKTWVEMTNAFDNSSGVHYEQYTLHQTKTYTDGTTEEKTLDNFTGDLLKGRWYNWELKDPDDAGVISEFWWYEYNEVYNKIYRRSGGLLPWSILTEV